MNNNEKLQCIYDIVYKILEDKAFSNLALHEKIKNIDDINKPFITKVVYGIIENDINLQYIIDNFCNKKPQKSLNLILKMGIFMLKNMEVPHYATVNNMVEFCKFIKKQEYCGCVNAVLKKVISEPIKYPSQTHKRLRYQYSQQTWLIGLLLKQYGEELTEQILAYKPNTDNQIRITNNAKFKSNITEYFDKIKLTYVKTYLKNVFYINNHELKKLKSTDYTNQSCASCLICDMLGVKDGTSVLDICSAPGGKSVYIASEHCNSKITATDLHEHRVQLIKKYAASQNATNIMALQGDATIYNPEFENKFDFVLCDVPCSGFGVFYSKPEIKYNRTYEGVLKLAQTQAQILSTASRYVKKGGVLMYSTCTILDIENQCVVDKFLSENSQFFSVPIKLPFKNFLNIGNYVQLIPPKDEVDGFFMAKLIKE